MRLEASTLVLALTLLDIAGCTQGGELSGNGLGGASGGQGGAVGTTTNANTTTHAGSTGSSSQSAGAGGSDGGPTPCTTRIGYGNRWIHPANHPESADVVDGFVTWDGACTSESPNSFAALSNGWNPYFEGNDGCAIALDYSGDCPNVPPSCTTRIRYGASWEAPPNHPDPFDDVSGAVFSDGNCRNDGGLVAERLSNGWDPHFQGNCALSFRWTQCGGLYQNPVLPNDCPDPGVFKDGGEYLMVCTTGDFGGLFPIHASKDLIHWSDTGKHIFAGGTTPTWANADFWAPEIHKLGSGYVAYFSARGSDGLLAVGAASSPTATGPFTDLGHPLVHDPGMSQIDAHAFQDEMGQSYLVWKDDGNAFGKPTPIWGQKLAPDGLSVVGGKAKLITNDLGWEGSVVEGPWVTRRGSDYYLFYSGNAYYNASYAVGVAHATSPLGPYTKAGAPILTSHGAWAGPGHGSVVKAPGGDDVLVFHAWEASHIGQDPGRVPLVDRIQWPGAWPTMIGAPSSASRPMP